MGCAISDLPHRRRAAQRWPVLPAPPRRMPTRPNPPLALRQIAEHRSVDPDRVSTVGYSAIISSRGVLDFLLGSPCAMNPPRRGRQKRGTARGGSMVILALVGCCTPLAWLVVLHEAPIMWPLVQSAERRASDAGMVFHSVARDRAHWPRLGLWSLLSRGRLRTRRATVPARAGCLRLVAI